MRIQPLAYLLFVCLFLLSGFPTSAHGQKVKSSKSIEAPQVGQQGKKAGRKKINWPTEVVGKAARKMALGKEVQGGKSYTVFKGSPLFWHGGLATEKNKEGEPNALWWNHIGDTVRRGLTLPELDKKGRYKVQALIGYKAVKKAGDKTMNVRGKKEKLVVDPWDRLGWVMVKTSKGEYFELLRFITGFGGDNEYQIDVSALAPILQGTLVFEIHIDNFAGTPAWEVSLDLVFTTDEKAPPLQNIFCKQVFPLTRINSENHPEKSTLTEEFILPQNVDKVSLAYITTGHGNEEFVRRMHLIEVNGKVVMKKAPWRDDCYRYLDKNPFTGVWLGPKGKLLRSSDFSRSNWCPSSEVWPILIDLKGQLKLGKSNKIEASILFPSAGKKGGYWPTSAYLFGTFKP